MAGRDSELPLAANNHYDVRDGRHGEGRRVRECMDERTTA